MPFRLGDIVECHEYSFGTVTLNEKTKKWEASWPILETSKRWRDKHASFVSYDEKDSPVFSYIVTGRTTCEQYARTAYGIPLGTWNDNRALLRKPAAMKLHVEMSVWDAAAAEASKKEKCNSTSEAVD
eukprot:6188708-Pleurochrysis_carterae.AAC.1